MMMQWDGIYEPGIDDQCQEMFGQPTSWDVDTLPKQLALALAGRMSWSRVDTSGGYHDKCAFIGDLIVVASLDYDGAPDLTIGSIPWFVVYHECWMEDEPELQALFKRCCKDPVFRRQVAEARRDERTRQRGPL